MKRPISPLVLPLAPAVLGLLALAGLRAAEPARRTFVGTDVCIRCHIDFAKRWASLEHSQAMMTAECPPDKRGCEACHGPGGEHVAGRRSEIIRWAKLNRSERSATCLQCHQGKVERPLWEATAHSKVTSCEQCHEVHKPVERDQMLKPAEGKECSPCHDNLAAEVAAKRHHSLGDGALVCGQCHNVHGTANSHLLNQPQAQLCADCHGDEVPKPESHAREGFKLGHAEDAKGRQAECLMCHDEQSFCNTCHSIPMPHPADFAGAHAELARQRQATCLQCHEADFCQVCHEQVPVPVEPGEKD